MYIFIISISRYWKISYTPFAMKYSFIGRLGEYAIVGHGIVLY